MDKDLYLGFINYVGETSDGLNLYEFMFTDNVDEFWGDGFEFIPSCLVNDLKPSDEYITLVMQAATDIKFGLGQNNCCFGMQDVLDGACSLAYEDISTYDAYPDNGRLIFMFGEPFEEVTRKLLGKNIVLEKKDEQPLD